MEFTFFGHINIAFIYLNGVVYAAEIIVLLKNVKIFYVFSNFQLRRKNVIAFYLSPLFYEMDIVN